MRILSPMVILLLAAATVLHSQAANEWQNPDEVTPAKKPAMPARAPAPARTAAPAPAPAPDPALSGQLSLQVIRVCDYQLSYVDKGSGGKIDGSFYLPNIPGGYAMIGAYAQGNYHDPSDCILAVKPANPESISLLQVPQEWKRLWTDKGSGASMDGSIWHASPASNNYVCLGSIARQGHKNPALENYVCVHRCLVENVPAISPVWSTRGTGAEQKVYVYKLHNSNSFYAVTNNMPPASLLDIKGSLTCTF